MVKEDISTDNGRKRLDKDSVKGIIFDLDGTLVDSLETYLKAMNMVLSGYGITITRDEIMYFAGMPAADVCMRYIKEKGIIGVGHDMIERDFSKVFMDLLKKHHDFPDSSRECITSLSKKGYRLAIGTGATRISALKMIPDEMMSYFVSVVTVNDISSPKPDPETFVKASYDMTLEPKDCLVVGDSPNDMFAAKGAEMKFVFIRNEYNSKFDGTGSCDYVIDDIMELDSIL